MRFAEFAEFAELRKSSAHLGKTSMNSCFSDLSDSLNIAEFNESSVLFRENSIVIEVVIPM